MQHLIAFIAAITWLTAGAQSAVAETRVALVVGNNAYKHASPLINPVNDARDMTAALKAAGFVVIETLDADKAKFDHALRAFADQLSRADVALFYYAGHGLQIGAQNYLVPTDAKLERERDLEFETIKLEFVLRQMEIDREGKTTIVILDACRDNPLVGNLARAMGTRSSAIGKGLAAAPAGLGTFIAYSTQPGNVALDGTGRNSPFAAAFVKHMGATGRNLPATMIEVRKDVVRATDGRQVPWDHSALTRDFYFVPGVAAPALASADTASPETGTVTGTDVAALQARLAKLEEAARQREAGGAAPPTVAIATPPVLPRPATRDAPPDFQLEENVRFEGLKLGEQRLPNPAACRDACERDPSCVAFQHGKRAPVMGICQTFLRVDAQQQDQNWRSGARAAIPIEQTAMPLPAKQVAAVVGAPPSRRDRGFLLWNGVSVIGGQIKMSATDSLTGCQIVCRNTPGCVAATYNDFFRGKNVACMVYSDVTSTLKVPSSILMVRTD